MMKKLLVFILVLGLASVANADLIGLEISADGVTNGTETEMQISIPVSTTVVIDMVGPVGDMGAYLIIEGNPGEVSGEWVTDETYPRLRMDLGAGDGSSFSSYAEADWGFGYFISDVQWEGTNPAGVVWEGLYHCLGEESDYVVISIWDAAGPYEVPDDVLVIHQVPEPMTIALLGLGGLVLLRRRK
jgi:hypothetical protein